MTKERWKAAWSSARKANRGGTPQDCLSADGQVAYDILSSHIAFKRRMVSMLAPAERLLWIASSRRRERSLWPWWEESRYVRVHSFLKKD